MVLSPTFGKPAPPAGRDSDDCTSQKSSAVALRTVSVGCRRNGSLCSSGSVRRKRALSERNQNNVQASPAHVYGRLALLNGEHMGMDVIGRKAVNASGEYYRASVWCWRPLHELLVRLCGDLLSNEMLERMEYNSGAGPEDPAVCHEIATRLRSWLLSFDDDVYFLKEPPKGVTAESMVMDLFGQVSGATLSGPGDYYIKRDRVEEFANFVESSGGFAVW